MRFVLLATALLLGACASTSEDEPLVWSDQLWRELPRERGEVIEVASFSKTPAGGAIAPWEAWSVRRGDIPTRYRVVDVDGITALEADAPEGGSGLTRKIRIDPKTHPILEWRWRLPANPDTRFDLNAAYSPLARLSLAFHGDVSKLDFDDRAKLRLALMLTEHGLPYASLLYVWMRDVPVDTVVLAVFSEPADLATITVTTGSTTVAGTMALQGDGSSATFTPTSELERDTTYDIDVSVCDSTSSSSFTTLPEGVAAADLEGKTYDFDLATAEWIEPSFGGDLVDLFEANHILIMIEDVDEAAETIDGLGAPGWESGSTVEQYPCADGADFDPVPFPDNPAFAFGPDEFSLGDKTFDVDIHDATVTGRFAADGLCAGGLCAGWSCLVR